MRDNIKRYAFRALRVGLAAAIGAFIGDMAGEPVIGFMVAGAYGLIGKMLRDKFPKLSWLPII